MADRSRYTSARGESRRRRAVRDRLRSRLQPRPCRLRLARPARPTRSAPTSPGIPAPSASRAGSVAAARCAAALARRVAAGGRLQSRSRCAGSDRRRERGAGRAGQPLRRSSAERLHRLAADPRSLSSCHRAAARASAPRDGRASALVAVHSFTPVYLGVSRPWEIGIVFDDDRRLADPVVAALKADPALTVGVNQPYAPDDRRLLHGRPAMPGPAAFPA